MCIRVHHFLCCNTDILHLIILSNLEVLNSELIEDVLEQSKRLEKLNNVAKRQLSLLIDEYNCNKKQVEFGISTCFVIIYNLLYFFKRTK